MIPPAFGWSTRPYSRCSRHRGSRTVSASTRDEVVAGLVPAPALDQRADLLVGVAGRLHDRDAAVAAGDPGRVVGAVVRDDDDPVGLPGLGQQRAQRVPDRVGLVVGHEHQQLARAAAARLAVAQVVHGAGPAAAQLAGPGDQADGKREGSVLESQNFARDNSWQAAGSQSLWLACDGALLLVSGGSWSRLMSLSGLKVAVIRVGKLQIGRRPQSPGVITSPPFCTRRGIRRATGGPFAKGVRLPGRVEPSYGVSRCHPRRSTRPRKVRGGRGGWPPSR